MKSLILLLTALLLLPVGAVGQELPQFSFTDFEGWSYNGGELTPTSVGGWKVTLYVTRNKVPLALISPEFSCLGMDSIHADVSWKSLDINIPLTMVMDDADGNPIDSVSCYPALDITAKQTLSMTLPVPAAITTARLRFVSWEANVNNGGAVQKIILTSITSTETPTTLKGDVDHDGRVSISDVTALINYLLSGSDDIDVDAADTDGDGRINISDVTSLINILLTGSTA